MYTRLRKIDNKFISYITFHSGFTFIVLAIYFYILVYFGSCYFLQITNRLRTTLTITYKNFFTKTKCLFVFSAFVVFGAGRCVPALQSKPGGHQNDAGGDDRVPRISGRDQVWEMKTFSIWETVLESQLRFNAVF
jgi:hypothetical protein